MRKLLFLFALLLTSVGAWAQVYQKISHHNWVVTALNEAGVQGNEGGVDYLRDENPSTFYHSNYNSSYTDGTTGKNKGQDGLQAFMVEMAEVTSFDKITYAGRSNGSNNWATKVRIYVYETLPDGWPKNEGINKSLSSLTYTEKEDLLKKEDNEVLGTPVFDNNTTGTWAADQNIKTAEFASTQTGKYILFVADATSSNNAYLTCADFHVWQKIEGIVEDKPYFLKLTNIAGDGDWYLDTNTPIGDTSGKKTIGKSTIQTIQTATYFTLHEGYWYISTLPGAFANFVSVDDWCATPQCAEPTPWLMEKNNDGTISLRQYIWEPGYLGGNQIISGSGENSSKVYTNQVKTDAVNLQLVELSDEELESENNRASEEKKRIAAEKARMVLGYIGVGYPAEESDARSILQAAIDADDATDESIYAAIEVYLSASQTVLLPEAGKVYRLVSASPTFSDKKVVYSDNTELKWQSKNEASMNQLWTVESINGMNLTLMNVGDAAYSQVSGFNAAVRTLPAKNESSLTFLGKGQFRVMCNKAQSMHANGNGNGANASGNITNYNDGLDSYSAWYFEEVAVTKEILAAQINSIKTPYLGSLLLKPEGIVGLQEAVDVAQAVHDANGNYAEAFSTLVAAVKSATFEYIDLGYFYIKSKGAQKYAYNNNNTLYVADSKSPKSIFKMSKAKNGTYYIQNGNGYYVQNTGNGNNTAVPISTNKVEYTITKMTSGHYVLRQTSSAENRAYWHDANNDTGKLVGWSTDGENTKWVFEALSDEEVAKIYTVNFTTYDASHYLSYKKDYSGDQVVKQDGGFYVLDTEPSESDFEQVGVTDPYLAKVLLYTENKNIRFTTGVNGENKYVIKCLSGNKYARYNSGMTSNGNNMLSNQSDLLQESLFYLEEGTGDFSGFYAIRSVAAPTLYAYNLGTADGDSKVAMKAAPAAGLTKEYYWKITYRNENGNPANITPYHEGGNSGDNYGWNKRGNNGNHIGYWYDGNDCNSQNDNKWYVRTIEAELTALGKIPLPNYTVDNSVIGWTTYESVYPYIGLDEIINSTGLNLLKNSTSTTYKVVAPKVGSFYRLQNVKSQGYMYGNGTTIKLTYANNANELISTVFYLDENNTWLSFTDGRYLNTYGRGYFAVGVDNASEEVVGKFSYAHGGAEADVITYNNNNHWTYGGADTDASRPDGLDRGTGTNQNGYNWKVYEVTSLPFTFNPAGLGFATFNAPVAVELPEGVLAYVTQINLETNTLQMYRLEDKVVPANTPVMLYCEAAKTEGATKELTIVSTYTGNEFDEFDYEKSFYGTIAAETYPTTGETVYSLRKSADKNTVGFYQKDSNTTLGGFKAWIKTTTSNARAFTIIFDGDDATGLKEALGLENENVEIYDLSGRRLDKPAKGVNVIGGKLVIK